VQDPAVRKQASMFLAAAIKGDPAYISHGEIQQSLSPDGVTWAPDLERRLVDDAERFDETRSVLVARRGDDIVAAAIVHWSLDEETRFATLEDIAVASAVRSDGIGRRMIAKIEAEAARRGAQWMFLESGLSNHKAHEFFERQGFRAVSKVMARKLRH
jgi:ribosomal protein S18 acetylase RimI-like enzyme